MLISTISPRTPPGWYSDLNADNRARRTLLRGFLVLLLIAFSGVLPAQEAESVTADDTASAYRLGPGDHVFVNIHNQDDLSGEYVLDGLGRFSMPLIGTVTASGLTAVGLEELLVSRLRPDYLVNPRISVRVADYRPYYIIGEVQKTGSYDFVQDIDYLTAIAIAGGYTYRAKKEIVFVTRGNDPDKEEKELGVHEKVRPGDIIRVAERLF